MRTQAQQDGVIINVLFMTMIELCRLKKEDYYDDEQPDETAVFCNSGFSFSRRVAKLVVCQSPALNPRLLLER